MSKITVKQINEETFNPILNQPFLHDQSTERKRKRLFQMQQRKAYLNETEIPKIESIIYTSSRCTTELSPSNIESKSPHQEALTIIQSKPQIETDAEVNVSDLNCSIESTEEKSKEKIKCDRLIKEYKPFIQLNNNLKYKVTIENKANTLSYLLALHQGEEGDARNKNYEVEEVIKEEKENELESPSKNKANFDITSTSKSPIPKFEEFGINKESVYTKKKIHHTNKSASMSKLNEFNNNKCVLDKKHLEVILNKKKEIKKLNISTSVYINKPKQTQLEGYRNNKLNHLNQNHMRSQTSLKPNDSLTKIIMNNISIKYQKNASKQKMKGINNSNSNILHQNNKAVCLQKKVIHRKNATVIIINKHQAKLKTNFNDKIGISTSSVTLHKKTSSVSITTNKQTVLSLIGKLKYVSNEHHLRAIQSINSSKRNVYVMVQKLKDLPSLIFRAVYEANSTNAYLNQIYSCSFCPFKISFDEMTVGYSYNSQKDIFAKEIEFRKVIRSGKVLQFFSL